MVFPRRKREPLHVTMDYYHGDHKPTHAGDTNYVPLTGPRLERLQQPGRKRPFYGSHLAMYLGAIFLGLRLTTGWTPSETHQRLGTHRYPSLNGQNLPSPQLMKKRKWLEVMEKAAPDFYHRRGVADVLQAYINNQDTTPLYDPEIFNINAADDSAAQRKAKLLNYFGLKEIKAKHTRAFWLKPISHDDEESPNPIEPKNRLQAVAQELLLHKQETRMKWGDLSYTRREALVKDQEKFIQEEIAHGSTSFEKLWAMCAHALLKENNNKHKNTKRPPSLSTLKGQMKQQTEAFAAQSEEGPLHRRFKHLTHWMPHV